MHEKQRAEELRKAVNEDAHVGSSNGAGRYLGGAQATRPVNECDQQLDQSAAVRPANLSERLFHRARAAERANRQAALAIHDLERVRELESILTRNPDLKRALELLDELGLR